MDSSTRISPPDRIPEISQLLTVVETPAGLTPVLQPYPLVEFERVKPVDFNAHALTHYFDIPRCYHLKACVVEYDYTEGIELVVFLHCGVGDRCAFKLNLNVIFANQMLYARHYDQRVHGSTQQSGSGASSADFPSSAGIHFNFAGVVTLADGSCSTSYYLRNGERAPKRRWLC